MHARRLKRQLPWAYLALLWGLLICFCVSPDGPAGGPWIPLGLTFTFPLALLWPRQLQKGLPRR
jgi:hypothetical protein